MLPAGSRRVVGLRARLAVAPLVYRQAPERPPYTGRRIPQSPWRRMSPAAASANVGPMPDPVTDRPMGPPLGHRLAAHRFTKAQLLAIDVATVVLVFVVSEV